MLAIATWKRLLIWGVVALGIVLAMPNVFYGRVDRHNEAVRRIEAQGPTPELRADRAAWPGWMPSGIVSLGLDLRGGAHLLAEVDLQGAREERMDALWPELRDALAERRAEIGTIRRQEAPPGLLRVRISQPENMQAALAAARSIATPVGGLTGVGQSNIEVSAEGDTLVVRLSDAAIRSLDDRVMRQTLEIIRRRIDETGTREPTIQRQGADRILIQVPGLGSAAELKSLIGTTARLTFHGVVGRAGGSDASAGPGEMVLPAMEEGGGAYIVEETPVVSGSELTNAQPSFDQNGQPVVTFRFNPAGARAFGDFTVENVGEPFAIVLDGEVVSAPVIREAIRGGAGQISGNFTVEETNELAILLRAGALPADLTFLQERTIGPQLGADSIRAGAMASVVALVLVMIFMTAGYGLFGLFANVALLVNLILLFALLSTLGATLTLPGIAGIVLTIGMAVDANVLVFERIREELKNARGPARAIDQGFSRALSAIADANVTTLITASVLYFMGAGPVRGFAVTLGLGIICSVFSAIFVTRLLIVHWMERRRPRALAL